MGSTTDAEFTEFVAASQRDLRRTAYLLCHDWDRADDALQTGLYRVYLKWTSIRAKEAVWTYARRAVVNAAINESKRAWRRETPTEELPEHSYEDHTVTVEDRLLLRAALASLPARQRAVVVLRYVDQLGVAETAAVLACPEGTITSSATRALGALRTFLIGHGFVRGGSPAREETP